MKATDDVLYSKIPIRVSAIWAQAVGDTAAGQTAELAVRLKDGSILTNGARFDYTDRAASTGAHPCARKSHSRFSVVPFHSITAAWTDGEVDDWSNAPFGISDIQKEVSVVVPSGGEEWKKVKVKDRNGRITDRTIHTLGDPALGELSLEMHPYGDAN